MAIAVLATLSSAIVPHDASAQLMTLPGKFDVAASGAATYTIAISVPPGTAGMVPSLSLEYNSQAGNGLLGVGWSVAGLLTVGRCSQTMAQDGVHGAVTFTATDRFCLDGQRLIAISGTYGADGAEYRTEVDGYTRVISHGTAGNGPAWFEVHTKSGQIMEFGHTADSQVLAQGTATARNWALDKVSDTKGNYFTVTYTNDTVNGQAYPIEIDYTGNAGTGLAPYNKVQFVYATRPDIDPMYLQGSLSQTTVRLTDIQTYAGATLVGDYSLAYQLSSTQRSELVSVTLCGAGNACLPATTFTWQGQWSFPGTAGFTAGWGGAQIVTGDFNGDGRTDFFVCPTSSGATCYVYYSTAGGGISQSSFTPTWGGYKVTAVDFNGDGLTDLFVCVPGATCTLYESTGTSFSPIGFTPGWGGAQIVTGDFNGDGRTDFFVCPTGNGVCYVEYSTGSGVSPSSFTPGWGGDQILAADFNGDGLTDVMVCPPGPGTGGTCYVYYSTGSGFSGGSFRPTWQGYQIVTGDFNGDGNADLFICPPAGTGVCYVYYSTGTSFVQGNFTPGWSTSTIYPLDFTGDGKTDLMACASTSGSTAPCAGYASTGSGFTSSSFNPAWAAYQLPTGDWAGLGAGSLLVDPGTYGTNVQQYVTTFTPELITTINNGLSSTTATYAPLTNSAVYTKDSSAYPLQDISTPSYVVSRVDTSNGIGGTYSSTYTYAGAKADLSGRGFLGFRQMTITDLQTGVVHTTNYRQDFPFLGLTASETKALAAQTLNQATNTLQFSNASGGTTLSTPSNASAPYRVSVAQTVASSFDLDGSVIPPVTTTFQYDAYGNATQVVTSSSDGYSKTTTSTYSNDTVNWLLGRLLTATVTAQAPSVTGGGQSIPDLVIVGSHNGNFVQGQSNVTYTITASNGGGGPTSGSVTVSDTLPSGLTATAMSGTGWSCTLSSLTCTRGDQLSAGAAYPAITLTANVASNAPASVTNVATVSGGGEVNTANDTANDPTTINPGQDLTIAKSHAGNFVQGHIGATYTITTTNVGTMPTSGTVTVTDTLPSGLTATGISGPGWSCTLATLTCTRGDALAAGAAYPAITLTVNVASNAPASVTNVAVVSGGGEANTGNDSASDVTTIVPPETRRVFLTSGTSWTVPADWNSANNTIEVIGAGGGGTNSNGIGNGGGGGGAYSKVVNATLTPGATVAYQVGVGGFNGSQPTTNTYLCNAMTNCTSLSASAVIVGAQGGSGGQGGQGGMGGSAANGVGTVRFSGGPAASQVNAGSCAGGAGGGAAGPNGNGLGGTHNTGGGEAFPGGAGDAGMGGAGGVVTVAGGPGGAGTEWDSSHGSGGGGAGGYGYDCGSHAGGPPGAYGAGAGGSSLAGPWTQGANGIIVITYVVQ